MARNRTTVKIYLAAIVLLEMSENENDKITKRGKATQHWIKRRDEKGYFTNILRELKIEGTTAYHEIIRRSSDFMTSMGPRFVSTEALDFVPSLKSRLRRPKHCWT
ncbi:PREDICTED: uncharacterized protein LOC107351735 [Acropora digitifera]|uniref:uncharacterized protein LOC107351735 n=1 Tax=Acropora digitifera TaxID=70779 RepID=UPI00077AE278|nr:PREDICTED: uncharacterized protein LOC107351735 [Acropora digitifera]